MSDQPIPPCPACGSSRLVWPACWCKDCHFHAAVEVWTRLSKQAEACAILVGFADGKVGYMQRAINLAREAVKET